MLPDFPEIRRQIGRVQAAIMQVEFNKRTPLLKQIRRFVQEEGDEGAYERDGGVITKEPFQEFKAPIELKIEEFGTISLSTFADRIAGVVDEMVRQQMTHFFQTLDKVTSAVGNSIDAAGRPWTPDLFLQMLEKMDMTFDKDGKPQITIVMHPEQARVIKEQFPNIEEDVEFKKKYDQIIFTKREAWLDRENNRKLVG